MVLMALGRLLAALLVLGLGDELPAVKKSEFEGADAWTGLCFANLLIFIP